MATVAYVVAYLAIAVFVIAVIARFVMWSKMPMHLRWELYPVPHEGKRARHGGSFMEESEWWKRKREVSKIAEVKAMLAEIVFLVAVKEHNPKLWVRSFPFHFGLYLVIGCTVLMFLGGILAAASPSAVAGSFGSLLGWAVRVLGWAGLVLGILGAIGLLARRLGDRDLRDYTTGADIFNLVFFIVAFGCALLTAALVDGDFSKAAFFVANLVTANLAALPGTGMDAALPTLTAILLGVLVAYIPLTHMSHFVGKYFAYHAIRWNDEPNLPGGRQEKIIGALLGQRVTWAAPHVQGEGKKTWVDVATEEQSK